MGLDPLHNSFINPLLRKLDKITSSIIIGKYTPEQENVPFNGKYIQLNLGNTIEKQKAYSIYLYYLQQFINQVIEEKELDFSKETVLNSDSFTKMLSVLRKEIRLNFRIQFKLNNRVIEKRYSAYTSSSFYTAIQKQIIPKQLTIESYLLFLYNELQSKTK